MKQFTLSIFISLLCASISAQASPRDTFKGRESMPVFSIIYQKNQAPLKCYLEYHDMMKYCFQKNVNAYFRVCSDYRFHNKNITNIYANTIDSLYIGHDFYKRILYSDSTKGILAKQILNSPINYYEYILDDYQDLVIKDSTKYSSFGLGTKNNQQSFIIFEKNGTYIFFNLIENDRLDLPITKNYNQLFSSREVIAFLKNNITSSSDTIELLDEYFKLKDLRTALLKIQHEIKK